MPMVLPSTEVHVTNEQQKDLLVQLYTMIQNDHGEEGVKFSSEMIQDYFNHIET